MRGDGSTDSSGDWSERCNIWDGICIYMLAQRRAARMEEIAEHGRPVSMRSALHKSKKVYDRKRLKKAGITNDDLPFCLQEKSYSKLRMGLEKYSILRGNLLKT